MVYHQFNRVFPMFFHGLASILHQFSSISLRLFQQNPPIFSDVSHQVLATWHESVQMGKAAAAAKGRRGAVLGASVSGQIVNL